MWSFRIINHCEDFDTVAKPYLITCAFWEGVIYQILLLPFVFRFGTFFAANSARVATTVSTATTFLPTSKVLFVMKKSITYRKNKANLHVNVKFRVSEFSQHPLLLVVLIGVTFFSMNKSFILWT